MLPIFKEYIQFLTDNNCPLKLQEGYFWVDNSIIKAFHNGTETKLCRIYISDDLSVTFSLYKNTPTEFESWEQTYQRLQSKIADKESESVDIINTMVQKYPNHKFVFATSKGKDSNLVEYLLNKTGISLFDKIYNNTTLDCADVVKEVKADKSCRIVTPKDSNGQLRSFYNMVRAVGTPSRFARWCCSYFKEGATIQEYSGQDNILFIMGVRNDESTTRGGYGFEIINPQWQNKTWIGFIPIKNWTELEVWLYMLHNKVSINSKYKKGYRRCGCHIACPYYTKSIWVLDKYWYPKMYERWHKILENDFISNEKWYRMNCTLQEYHMNWNGGLIRKEPNEEVIQEFMQYKGIVDKSIALKYFNKSCDKCGKQIFRQNVIAMNLKLFGRQIDKFLCQKCLMKEFGLTKEKWNEMVRDFKSQGCKLF